MMQRAEWKGERLEALVRAGRTIQEIADELGLNYDTVQQQIKAQGLKARGTYKGRPATPDPPLAHRLDYLSELARWSTEELRRIVRLRLIDGLSNKEIALRLRCDLSVVEAMQRTAFARAMRRFVYGIHGGRRTQNRRNGRYLEDRMVAATEMFSEGCTIHEIYRVIEVPYSALATWCESLEPALHRKLMAKRAGRRSAARRAAESAVQQQLQPIQHARFQSDHRNLGARS